MASKSVLLVHGWSAKDRSMLPIAKFLERNGFTAMPLMLGSYTSLYDDVRIEDAAKRAPVENCFLGVTSPTQNQKHGV
ncbi:MAG: hypothetical protein ABJG15_10725 [Hyphomonadaceae bacterium]